MPMPSGIGVIDLMLAVPTDQPSDWYDYMKPMLRDAESREQFKMPAQYMFKNIPTFQPGADLVQLTVAEMDKYGIERAMLGINAGEQASGRSRSTRSVSLPVTNATPMKAWTRCARLWSCTRASG
jgi:hypothetical protein